MGGGQLDAQIRRAARRGAARAVVERRFLSGRAACRVIPAACQPAQPADRGPKSESARSGRALLGELRAFAVGGVPRDPRNVRTGDADIGQFAVAELIKLA